VRLVSVTTEPLAIPLLDPFVIATARVDHTTSVRVDVVVEHEGQPFRGRGEAAALHPVTHEHVDEIATSVQEVAPALLGRALDRDLTLLAGVLADRPVARAGLEQALLDAVACAQGVPVHALLAPGSRRMPLVTDVTLPILPVERMVALAVGHRAAGFTAFKVKVGKDEDHDRAALAAIARAVPDARFRLDANAALSAEQALALLRDLRGLTLECFEQPCARDDLDGMAHVTAEGGVPVIADESVRDLADLERIVERRAAHGVNLKRVKSGGMLPALAIGRAARAAGLTVMVGAMVETWLGLYGMAHVAVALGGADFVDLDTAFLLAEPTFAAHHGPTLELPDLPGLGLVDG